MSAATLAIACAVLTWWGATGALLYVVRQPRATHARSMVVMSALGLFGIWAIVRSAGDASVSGAYAAFAGALLLWAWQEAAFLLGFVTPRAEGAGQRHARRWRRFVQAALALRWHQVAMAAGAVLVIALAWNAANPVAAWTYAVLWVMRISAQLNLFLGVRNRGEDLLPPHLRHLDAFFEHRRVNPLWFVSMAGGAWACWHIARAAVDGGATDFVVTAHLLVASLLALAVVEHLFMVLPLRLDALWRRAPRGGTP